MNWKRGSPHQCETNHSGLCNSLQGTGAGFGAHSLHSLCLLPQLAVPRMHAPRSKQVVGARLQIQRVPPPARTRPVLHRRRRRLVARYQVLGVRVREQPARVLPLCQQ